MNPEKNFDCHYSFVDLVRRQNAYGVTAATTEIPREGNRIVPNDRIASGPSDSYYTTPFKRPQ